MNEINALERYFSELNEEQLRYLVSAAEYQAFPQGKRLAVQGERGDRAFILLEGEVEIAIHHQGCDKIIGVRSGGHILGEMALLEDKPRAATLTTKTPVKAFVLKKNAFHGLLAAQPELSLAINRSLSARMRLTQETLFQDMVERITALEEKLAATQEKLDRALEKS